MIIFREKFYSKNGKSKDVTFMFGSGLVEYGENDEGDVKIIKLPFKNGMWFKAILPRNSDLTKIPEFFTVIDSQDLIKTQVDIWLPVINSNQHICKIPKGVTLKSGVVLDEFYSTTLSLGPMGVNNGEGNCNIPLPPYSTLRFLIYLISRF